MPRNKNIACTKGAASTAWYTKTVYLCFNGDGVVQRGVGHTFLNWKDEQCPQRQESKAFIGPRESCFYLWWGYNLLHFLLLWCNHVANSKTVQRAVSMLIYHCFSHIWLVHSNKMLACTLDSLHLDQELLILVRILSMLSIVQQILIYFPNFSIGLVVKKFKLKDDREVRAHFKAKLNNTERCLKVKKEHWLEYFNSKNFHQWQI